MRHEDFDADDISFGVVVKYDAGFILIALLYHSVAQLDIEDVNFLIVCYFHFALQYFATLLVLYTVRTLGGSSCKSTITRTR